MVKTKIYKNTNIFQSMSKALNGIWLLIKTEQSIRWIVLTNIAYWVLSYYLHFNYIETIIGSLAWLITLMSEITNSAFENDMDYTGNHAFHPAIKRVKDFAAAVVFLISSFACIVSWYFIFQHI